MAETAVRTLLREGTNDGDGLSLQQLSVIRISVLDSTGRYALAWDPCCGSRPAIESHLPDSGCAELSRPPVGMEGHWDQGVDCGLLLHQWMQLDRPTGFDGDGDGIPCEDNCPQTEIDSVVGSPPQP